MLHIAISFCSPNIISLGRFQNMALLIFLALYHYHYLVGLKITLGYRDQTVVNILHDLTS